MVEKLSERNCNCWCRDLLNFGEIPSGPQDFFSSSVNNRSVKYAGLITAKKNFRLTPWLSISITLEYLKKWSSVSFKASWSITGKLKYSLKTDAGSVIKLSPSIR